MQGDPVRVDAWRGHTYSEYPQRGVAPSGVPTSHARAVPAASAVVAWRGTGRPPRGYVCGRSGPRWRRVNFGHVRILGSQVPGY